MQVHPGDITSLGGVPVRSGYITIVMGVISVIKERQRERYIYINMKFFNPVVFVKGKLILVFCSPEAIWLKTRAAPHKGERKVDYICILSVFLKFHTICQFNRCVTDGI